MSIILTRLHTSWSSKKPWIDKWFLDNDTVDKHEKTELLNSLLYSIAHKNVGVGYAMCLNAKKNCVEGWCSESSGTERDIWKYVWNVIVYDENVNPCWYSKIKATHEKCRDLLEYWEVIVSVDPAKRELISTISDEASRWDIYENCEVLRRLQKKVRVYRDFNADHQEAEMWRALHDCMPHDWIFHARMWYWVHGKNIDFDVLSIS